MAINFCITNIFANKFIGNIVLRFLQGAFAILSSMFVARALGAESYGEFVTLLSIVATLSIPLAAGVPMYSLKEMVSHAQENNSIVRYQFLMGLKRYMLGAAFLILIVTSVWQILASVTGIYDDGVSTILLGAIAVVIGINTIFSGVIRGGNKLVLCNVPEMGVRSSIFLACSILIWVEKIHDLKVVLYALLLSCLASLCVSLRLMPLKKDREATAAQDISFRIWLSKLYPYFLASIFTILTANIDLLLLAFFCRPEEVGLYKIAFQMAAVMPLVSTVYYNTNCHQILKLYKCNSGYAVKKFLRSFFCLSGFAAFGMLTTIFLFGEEVLVMFYGVQFVDAYNPLLILTLSQCIVSILGMGLYVLNITGNPRAALISNIYLFLTNVLFGFVLIPLYGVIGASVANLLSAIVGYTYSCSIAWGLFYKKNYG